MTFTNRNRVQVLAGTALALLVALAGGCSRSDEPVVGQFKGLDITGVPYGKDFKLTDHNNQERTLADFKGKVVMLYFGFVQCPDVCPTALTRAVETKQLLGADGERLQVIFVTVDPERDTAPILKAYMDAFDPSFLALSTDAQHTRETADSFKAYYKKVPTGSSYTMDHSALSYLFDPSGNLRVAMRHEQTAKDYAHDIALLLKTP
ncbi:SCO family protein [Rhodoferax antarcticus]|uniref:Electron transport protein SCO1/SenC family protein n=1 Tax=Rhodoferax antarcticus ANT.BR TaxID=1111071 RepID=A0A1Q8YDE2_9BURK|nr:SCO family protein [Rhodoferax antarcticus]APW45909.1 SCO family protein [Rhodoferax antarcticus]MCW2310549.1 protein SCO1/2 [Rhodoferax antarcticus]OLP06022.1 electron transport protein SCO1/SenC family protein [Rhodoferax antarcticus ANT.BR]